MREACSRSWKRAMIDLAPHHLETVKRILAEHLPGCEVRAFGSRATWTAWEYSDLDLAVVSPEPLAWDRRGRLREAFEESDLPIRVDIVDWESLSDGFRQTIDGDCVVLQEGAGSRDWRETTIGECAVINDSTYSPKEQWPFINYLDTGNITANRVSDIQHLISGRDKIPSRARRKCKPGDIVYSTVRPNQRHFGVLKQIPKNFLASTGFAVLRGKKDIADTDYLYYFLSQDHIVEHLHTIAEHSTSAYPSIKPSDIASVEISLPPLDEQRRIARILATLDDKIELNRRISQTLEAMAQALFKSWFIDFDPVRAKAEGRPTNLPPHLDALFPDSFQDSELGEIPDGWQVGTIDDMCSRIENGGTPRRRESEYWGGTIDWFKTGELTDGPLLHSEERISDLGLAKSSCKLWPRGTILIALYASPTVGRLGILERPATANQACSALQAKPEFGEQFVFHTLFEARERLQNIAVGAAQQNISQQVVRDCSVVIPHHSVARAFSDISEPHYRQRVANVAEISTLAATRDALLTQLIPGNHGPDLVLQPTADSSTASAGTARSAYSSRI